MFIKNNLKIYYSKYKEILFIIIVIIIFNKYLNKYSNIYSNNEIKLFNNYDNIYTLYGDINYINIYKLLNNINLTYKNNNKNLIIINSNGGDMFAGYDFIKFFRLKNGPNIDCYAIKAYSIAFSIFQNCNKRIINYNKSVLMQHEIKIKINKYIKISYINKLLLYINNINYNIKKYESNKLKIDYNFYNKIIKNDFYFNKTSINKYNINIADIYI